MSKQISNLKSQNSSNTVIYNILLIMAGLVLPVFLISLVKFTGYSEIVEEIAKALVVLFLILAPYRTCSGAGLKLSSHKAQIFAGAIFGFLFGLSENIFYLNNIFQLGDFSIFWQRFLWTVPMHIITVLIILLPALKNKKLIILGLVGAIILHALFNGIVAGFLI